MARTRTLLARPPAAVSLLLLALIAAVAGPTAYAGPAESSTIYLPAIVKDAGPSGVVVLSSTAFVPYTGANSVYVVGEVKNYTTSNVRFVKVNAELQNAAGVTVKSYETYVLADVIPPGGISPFRAILSDVGAWSKYKLSVTWSTTTAVWPLLEFKGLATSFDASDAFHVTGTLHNPYAVARTSVQILVTMYNSAGVVIGVDWDYASPRTVPALGDQPFDLETFFWAGKPNRATVARYAIMAGGD